MRPLYFNTEFNSIVSFFILRILFGNTFLKGFGVPIV